MATDQLIGLDVIVRGQRFLLLGELTSCSYYLHTQHRPSMLDMRQCARNDSGPLLQDSLSQCSSFVCGVLDVLDVLGVVWC